MLLYARFYFPFTSSALTHKPRHNIYKWQADKRRQAARPRSASFAGSTRAEPVHPAFEHIHEPGGFRRTYVMMNDPERATEPPMVRNFIEFLYIFGHFVSILHASLFLYALISLGHIRLVKTSRKSKRRRNWKKRRSLAQRPRLY